MTNDDAILSVLTRIADALDRISPPKSKSAGPLKPGVAEYNYEDAQTLELRRQFQQTSSHGPEE